MKHRQRDITILFVTRFARMFAYGLVSIVLVLYLTGLGFDQRPIGLLLSMISATQRNEAANVSFTFIGLHDHRVQFKIVRGR
jgi:hypothetical protein